MGRVLVDLHISVWLVHQDCLKLRLNSPLLNSLKLPFVLWSLHRFSEVDRSLNPSHLFQILYLVYTGVAEMHRATNIPLISSIEVA